MLSRLAFVCAAAFIAFYLWTGRSHGYSDWEQEVRLGSSQIYSDPIDVTKKGTVEWKVPLSGWVLDEGEAQVALILEPNPGDESGVASDTSLRVRFGAYATSGSDSPKIDRRVRNWYFTTDEPFSEDARIWSVFGYGYTEYGLGGVSVYPQERLFITVDILEPDPALASANPRLMIVPKHDYAVMGHVAVVRLIRDGGLAICMALLLFMTIMNWRRAQHREALAQ